MNSIGINQYSYRQRRPIGVILWSWFGALASLLFLIPASGMMLANVASYRSCSINTSGLSVSNCGKHSIDVSDLILLGLFVGALLIVFCALTHAFRMTRKS